MHVARLECMLRVEVHVGVERRQLREEELHEGVERRQLRRECMIEYTWLPGSTWRALEAERENAQTEEEYMCPCGNTWSALDADREKG